jgi:serine/threonine protein kinase
LGKEVTLQTGYMLDNRYRIIGVVDRRIKSTTYHAVDETLDKEVFIQEYLAVLYGYSFMLQIEISFHRSVQHPNVLCVIDHFAIENQGIYLVMEYGSGETLRQRLEQIGLITNKEAIRIGIDICNALIFLHTYNPPIFNIDICPASIIINSTGAAIHLGSSGLSRINYEFRSGSLIMQPRDGYRPPEQYGMWRSDPRSDIYALGATLYAVLTGVIPEDGLARVMDNVQLTPVRKRNSRVSRKLAAVIEKAMEPYPDNRYQTADDFKQALLGLNVPAQEKVKTFFSNLFNHRDR